VSASSPPDCETREERRGDLAFWFATRQGTEKMRTLIQY